MTSCAALILAAGRSRRMGRPKALLEHPRRPGHSFVTHLVDVYRAARCEVVVVCAPALEASLAAALAPWRDGLELVVNPRPDSPMIASVRLGLAACASRASAVLLQPVDCPGTELALVRALLDAAAQAPLTIHLPSHAGRPGHPVLVPAAIWPELLGPEADQGAHLVVMRDPERLRFVPWDDARVCRDIDTLAEYEAFRRSAAGSGDDG